MAPAVIVAPCTASARAAVTLRAPCSPRPMASLASRLSRAVVTGVRAMSTASAGGVPVEVRRRGLRPRDGQGSALWGSAARPRRLATADPDSTKPIPSRISAAPLPGSHRRRCRRGGSRRRPPSSSPRHAAPASLAPHARRCTTPTVRCAWWSPRRCPATAGSRWGHRAGRPLQQAPALSGRLPLPASAPPLHPPALHPASPPRIPGADGRGLPRGGEHRPRHHPVQCQGEGADWRQVRRRDRPADRGAGGGCGVGVGWNCCWLDCACGCGGVAGWKGGAARESKAHAGAEGAGCFGFAAACAARCHPRLPAACPRVPQDWGAELFGALKAAGGRAYSNYAVG